MFLAPIKFIKDSCKIQFSQFRRLFTKEDAKYAHMHKIIGMITLTHFFGRLLIWWKNGDMGLHDSEMKWFTLGLYLVHTLLHVTSFEFHVPNRRNAKYNVIWPEMRWHTMFFAYRSLLVLFLHWILIHTTLFSIFDDLPIKKTYFFIIARGIVVLSTMYCADKITLYYRKKDDIENSENTSQNTSMTMRGNPYPDYISQSYIKFHNLFYSISQVLATLNVISASCMDKVFLLLLPIQTAPFCMTLVKKGVINQAGWHFYYSLALLINYITLSPIKFQEEEFGLVLPKDVYLSLAIIFIFGRFIMHWNKYTLWSAIIFLHLLLV